MYKCVLLDLDGTLINSNEARFEEMKYGKQSTIAESVPLINGAVAFMKAIIANGFKPVVVSDSHHKFVEPVVRNLFSRKLHFDIPTISLADKPSVVKTQRCLEQIFPRIGLSLKDCIMVGDTHLDIELARGLGIPSVLVKLPGLPSADSGDGLGKAHGHLKSGPTFVVDSYAELTKILESPLDYLLPVEKEFRTNGANSGKQKALRIVLNLLNPDRSFLIRALGRQEGGLCDEFSVGGVYSSFQSDRPDQAIISEQIGGTIGSFLRFVESTKYIEWHYLTIVPDKSSTRPRNKMQNLLNAVVGFAGKKLLDCFVWNEEILGTGTIRSKKDRSARNEFLHGSLIKGPSIGKIKGKNVIVIDDQLTTGATAIHCNRLLKDGGAETVLFVVPFYMISDVNIKECPKCRKIMKIRTARASGNRFYSCVSAEWGGDGCGHTENFGD
jgi:phosphoglycolate phosphatase-like HAD superfamily hydrolase